MRAPSPDEVAIIAAHEQRFAATKKALPAVPVPCFGYLRTPATEVLVGPLTHVSAEVRVVDWRRAPLAGVYLGHAEGEPFQVPIDAGRDVAGTVLERTHLTVSGGQLVEIARPDRRFHKVDQAWQVEDGPEPELLTRRPKDQRSHAPIVLDARQAEVVAAPAGQPLLVLGEAGFGKTTVALHRVAKLVQDGMPGSRVLMLVPTIGLARLSRVLLDRLDVRGVRVSTVDDWMLAEARATVPKLPTRNSVDGTVATLRLKRHPALRAELVRMTKRKAATKRKDLLTLFGDSEVMARVAASAGLPPHAVAEVIEHTKVQFTKSSERDHAHVDAARLQTLDGARIDEGTPMGDADSLDAEDAAVLLELHHLRKGEPRATWQHIVLDEAQELSPIELAVIGRALAPGGTLTVAGDEAQQTDDTASFPGWTEAMIALGAPVHQRSILLESHRCPPEVEAYARALVGRGPPPSGPLGAIAQWRARSACERTRRLADELARVEADDPTARIGLVCRTPTAARAIAQELGRARAVKLALDGDFDFLPGVLVTTVAEIKGLEVDVVIVPDMDSYDDELESKRALYVAVTRAMHQVLLVHGA